MVSPSTLKPSAPSANLLRYLRSQWESANYFSTKLLHFHNYSVAAAGVAHRSLPPCPWRFQSQRVQAFSSWTLDANDIYPPCRTATLEASLFPFFIPRPRKSLATTTKPLFAHDHSMPTPTTPRSTIKSLNNGYLLPFSSTTGKRNRSGNFIRRLLGLRASEHDPKLRVNDFPIGAVMDDGPEGSMFATGRSLAMKATNEPRLRCTELDENGNVTLVNGEFKKSELIAKYGLLPRDLRKIDSSVLPHILVRPRAILISLLHLRVLIKSDRVLVFDAYGSTDSYTQSVFMYDLEGKLRQKEAVGRSAPGSLPYEFRALEAVLVSVTSGLEAEFEGVREPVVRVLRALEEDIDRDKLRHLLIYSKRLGTFEQKARLVRDAIEDLLEADDDLTAMYLSEKRKDMHRQEHDHQEIEMLLESYHKVCDEIVQASGNLVTNIRNTEEIVKAILDANRNSLMLLDLKFSIGTLGLAAGTLCSALYGMNLKNFIEESELGFAAVSGACFAFTAFVCGYGLMKLRKVQRVRMWGEAGLHDRGIGALGLRSVGPAITHRANWRADSIDPLWRGVAGETRGERLKRLRYGAAVSSSASSPAAAAVAAASTSSRGTAEKAKRVASTGGKDANRKQQRQHQPSYNEATHTGNAESVEIPAALSSVSR
ncbi:uncharacterized protein PADG_07973 [Paracoccidioides brasiliensis Pb18]|uniref:Mitochondrial inner membrane magnesium transporter MRS2 n=1 Tax=Paracoccidioides brasiliensis (strain Pb18) TaxID=502780 RepID=C1GKW6_PARBD|nr:uncharacterized protein PADG_07973 [Paracoccidioides brasiliensis Pb18]EEH43153.1 hypothetical protein PADG_07973 [Paracoccidioides brasiliensis Pb18]